MFQKNCFQLFVFIFLLSYALRFFWPALNEQTLKGLGKREAERKVRNGRKLGEGRERLPFFFLAELAKQKCWDGDAS